MHQQRGFISPLWQYTDFLLCCNPRESTILWLTKVTHLPQGHPGGHLNAHFHCVFSNMEAPGWVVDPLEATSAHQTSFTMSKKKQICAVTADPPVSLRREDKIKV